MKVQFDQNGFKAQMNSSDTSAEALKHGIRTAKKHTALIFGILSLVLMLALFPYAMLLDISSDIVDLFVTEGFQSAQEFDEAISELGIPFSLGSLLYSIISTVNLHRYMAFLIGFGFLALIADIVLAVMGIMAYAKNKASQTATAGLILAIVSLAVCVLLAVISVALLV